MGPVQLVSNQQLITHKPQSAPISPGQRARRDLARPAKGAIASWCILRLPRRVSPWWLTCCILHYGIFCVDCWGRNLRMRLLCNKMWKKSRGLNTFWRHCKCCILCVCVIWEMGFNIPMCFSADHLTFSFYLIHGKTGLALLHQFSPYDLSIVTSFITDVNITWEIMLLVGITATPL